MTRITDEAASAGTKGSRIENALAFASFIASLVVYIKTLAPTITFMDSGELAVDCITLSIAHPTGYPLFVILGHLWSMLPIPGSPIYKLNLFAAVCTALSVPLFFKITLLILRRLNRIDNLCEKAGITEQFPSQSSGSHSAIGIRSKRDKRTESTRNGFGTVKEISSPMLMVIAFAAALAYGFARTIWQQATAIEVYSLHLLLIQTLLLLFLRAIWAERQRAISYYMAALALGLSFSNHMTTIWLAPAIFYLFFKHQGLGKSAFLHLLKLAVPFAAGLAFYLYLPLRSAGHFPFHGPPHSDWGGVGRGWRPLFYHVSAGYYRPMMFTGTWLRQLGRFLSLYPFQMGIVGILPMAAGFWISYRRSKEIAIFLTLMIGTCLLFAINDNIPDIDSYFVTAFIPSLWFMAIGFYALAAFRTQIGYAALLIPLIALGMNYGKNDLSRDHLVEEYTKNTVDNLGPNAILFSAEWKYLSPGVRYMQREENYRKDMVFIESAALWQTWYLDQLSRQHPEILRGCQPELVNFRKEVAKSEFNANYDHYKLMPQYLAFMNALIDTNITSHPIYFTTELYKAYPGLATGYNRLPAGLVFQWMPKSPSLRPQDAKFDFTHFLSYSADSSDFEQVGIYEAAAKGVERSAKLQEIYGNKARADEFTQLADRLMAKISAN